VDRGRGRLDTHEVRGIELRPERQRGQAVRVRALVLRHARQGGFADADFTRDLPPGCGPLGALGVDGLVELLEVEFHVAIFSRNPRPGKGIFDEAEISRDETDTPARAPAKCRQDARITVRASCATPT
jgi:hypothetical protein